MGRRPEGWPGREGGTSRGLGSGPGGCGQGGAAGQGCGQRAARGPGHQTPQQPPRPQQAMNVLHELLFAREFEKATREAFPELLLVLLTQMHYVLELTLPEEPQPSQEAPGAAMPRAQR